MMPLPWFFVFMMVFMCVFTVFLMISMGYISFLVNKKSLKIKFISIPW